jgi:Zn-dependent protease
MDQPFSAADSLDPPIPATSPSAPVAWVAPHRDLREDDVRSRPRRRVVLPIFLFLATCGSTFLVGAVNWNPEVAALPPRAVWQLIGDNWRDGVIYMAAVICILLTHEMGHFLQAVRYGVPASFPFFIPMPIMFTGTMGAVIGMEGSRADRKQLFDIGLSGPWAGLIVALPIVWFGIKHGVVSDPQQLYRWHLGDPLIFKLMTWLARPELPPGSEFQMNPLLMAGWVGMLITGLNMLPVSQLDGGHVIYSLFGRRSYWIARGFVMSAIAAMIIADYYQWVVMLVLVLMLGVDHPPTRDDHVPLGLARRIIGTASLAIPIFCFTPRIV